MKNARLLGHYIGRRFQSSKPLILFIPNEDLYVFEGEKLSQEENRAAIPKRPNFNNIPKVHHEMLGPEFIADLVIKPGNKDVIVTSLAQNSPFGGEPSYKVIPKDVSKPPTTVELLYSEISRKYIQVFNNQISQLNPLKESSILPTLGTVVAKDIEDRINDYKTINNINDIFTIETLQDIGDFLHVFENTRKVSLGEVDTANAASLVTLENFCIYNVRILGADEDEKFNALITFIKDNFSLFTVQGLRRLVETLIEKLSVITNPKIIDLCCNLVIEEMFINYSNMLFQLDPVHLDRLAGILSVDKNINYATRILSALIESRNIAPSDSTVEKFLTACADVSNGNQETFIRDSSILKSVFFSRDMSTNVGKLILDNGIRTIYELENFVKLSATDGENVNTLQILGNEIIGKLLELQQNTNESDTLKSMRVIQVIDKLNSKGYQLDKAYLSEVFKSLNDDKNHQFVDKL